ncbi:hypothetical protein FXO37_17040 [Capsicum annuum]|nr:hypothetical protein FXO37_17040 [Capsicum annuum]
MTKNDEPSSCLKCVDKEHLVVGLVNTNSLLLTHIDTSILPSINSSCMQIQEYILPKEDPRRVPYEHMLGNLTEFLAKNSNFGKNSEEMIQGRSIDKLPCDESFPKEQVSCHDTHQGEGRTSCELQGNNAISYTPTNFEYRDVAIIIKVDVVEENCMSFTFVILLTSSIIHFKSLALAKPNDNPDGLHNFDGLSSMPSRIPAKVYSLSKADGFNSLPLNSNPISKKDVLCETSEITSFMTPSDMQYDVLKIKGGMLKIYLLSYFLKSIKNIGLSKDFVNHPIVDNDHLLLEKNDQLGDDNLGLLKYLRNPINDFSCKNGFGCDPYYAHDVTRVRYISRLEMRSYYSRRGAQPRRYVGPMMVPQSSSTLVLEGLLICLLTCLECAPLSTPGVAQTLSIIPLSVIKSAYGVPPILSMDPSIVSASTYGTPPTPSVVSPSILTFDVAPPFPLDSVHSVCEFMDVFSMDLPGILPNRDIYFSIDIEMATKPVSIPPYRIAPTDLKKLKDQLQELLDKGFI